MFMLTNILVNFVILAAYQPLAANAQGLALPDPPQTAQDRVQTALEPWFQFIFSFEALVKIIALDAFGAHSYSSDGWNVFDFAVVVLCYLNYVPNTGNATALRTLRALRPLRSFGLVPALRRTFNGIMAVAYHEVRVEIIDWFLMFVVTLTGVQLWAGAMSGGCFYPDPFGSANVSTGRLNFASNTAGLIAGTDRTVVPGWVRNRFVNYLFYSAQDAAGVCGLQRATTGFAPGPAACPAAWAVMPDGSTRLQNSTCLDFQNPLSWGQPQMGLSYDNVGIGFLTTYVMESEEGWANIVYTLWNGWGANWVVAIFFVFCIFSIDDFTAVMTDACSWDAFQEAIAFEADQDAEERRPEVVAHSRALERAALSEMWGTWAPKDKAADDARAAAASKAFWSSLWAGVGKLWDLFPNIPEVVAKPLRAVEQSALPGVPALSFNNIMQTVVMANIICMACEYEGQPVSYNNTLAVVNIIFVAIFVFELVVRMGANGVRTFLSDGFSAFDFVIVVSSVVEIIVNAVSTDAQNVGVSAIRVMRIFRVFRALKLARGFKKLNQLLSSLARAVPRVASIGFIMLIIAMVFTAIGMQVFGGLYNVAIQKGLIDEYPRHNYDSFGWGLVSAFTTIEGEDWFIAMYEHIAIFGAPATIFWVVLHMIGSIVFSLVVAVFMLGFDEEEEAEAEEELEHELEAAKKLAAATAAGAKPQPAPAAAVASTVFSFDPYTHLATGLVVTIPPRGYSTPSGIADAGAVDAHSIDARGLTLRAIVTDRGTKVVGVRPDGVVLDPTKLNDESTGFTAETLTRAPAADLSLFMLPPSNGGRIAIASLVSHPYFEWLSLAVTMLSCVNLALDEPWLSVCPSTDSACAALNSYLFNCDSFVIAWFTFEAVLKIIAQGFVGFKHSYLASGWNVVDFVIVVTSIVGHAMRANVSASSALPPIRALRGVRVIRVLRLIKQAPMLSEMADTLAFMLPAAISASVLVFLFVYIFAIIGQQSFSGILYACNDFSVSDKDACVGTFFLTGRDCAYLPTLAAEQNCARLAPLGSNSTFFPFPRRWDNLNPNWDNFGSALLQTYFLADGENWIELMYATVDGSNDSKTGMSRDNNQARAIYFILTIIVLDCVVIDLFTGVVKTTFKYIRTTSFGKGHLTHGQRKLAENTQLVLEARPLVAPRPPAEGSYSRTIFNFVTSPSFDAAITALVVAAALVVAMYRYPIDALTLSRLNGLYYLFTSLFALEMLAKLFALGPFNVWVDPWAFYECTVTAVAVVGMGFSLAAENNNGPNLEYGVMRIALGARILRLFKVVRDMRHVSSFHFLHHVQPVTRAIYNATPRVIQCVLFFSVVIFMYCVIGMSAFGLVRFGYAGNNMGGNPPRSTGNLNQNANFDSFPKGMYTLYRAFTGEGWNSLCIDHMVQPPYCNASGDQFDNCGEPIFAPIFWISYMIIADMIVDSLLTAVVLEAFWHEMPPPSVFSHWIDNAGRKLYNFTHHASEQFVDAWAIHDPFGDVEGITRKQLEDIVLRLDAPLGVCEPAELSGGVSPPPDAAAASALVASLAIDSGLQTIPFHMALHALVLRASEGFGSQFGGAKLSREVEDTPTYDSPALPASDSKDSA